MSFRRRYEERRLRLRGRPRGRNSLQRQIWSENEEKIVYALMDKYPRSARLKYLEEKTGLTRPVLLKHLETLEAKGIVTKDEKVYSLNPKFAYLNEVSPERTINTPNVEDGTLVVRAEAISPFDLEIYEGNNLLQSEEGLERFEATIPIHGKVTVKFSGGGLRKCQTMVFEFSKENSI